MPRQIAILDTNLYRSLSHDAIEALRAAERRSAATSVASFYTIVELCAHLADLSDKDLPHCRAALTKLWIHTRLYDGSQEYVPITGHRDALLVRSLFHRKLSDLDAAAQRYGRLVKAVAHLEGPLPASWQPTLVEIRSRAEQLKSDFVTQAEQWSKALSGGQQSWTPLHDEPERRREFLTAIDSGTGIQLLAESLASRAAARIGHTLSSEERLVAAEVIKSTCGVALHFYNLLIRKLVDSGYNLTKDGRRTAVWDYQLAFEAGATALAYAAPVVLVTGDRLLHKAAENAGRSQTVLTVEQYRSRLGL